MPAHPVVPAGSHGARARAWAAPAVRVLAPPAGQPEAADARPAGVQTSRKLLDLRSNPRSIRGLGRAGGEQGRSRAGSAQIQKAARAETFGKKDRGAKARGLRMASSEIADAIKRIPRLRRDRAAATAAAKSKARSKSRPRLLPRSKLTQPKPARPEVARSELTQSMEPTRSKLRRSESTQLPRAESRLLPRRAKAGPRGRVGQQPAADDADLAVGGEADESYDDVAGGGGRERAAAAAAALGELASSDFASSELASSKLALSKLASSDPSGPAVWESASASAQQPGSEGTGTSAGAGGGLDTRPDEKTGKHVVPHIARVAKTGLDAFESTSSALSDTFRPYLGAKYSPLAATLVSYTLLLLPLAAVAFAVERVRAAVSLQLALHLAHMYLATYCFALFFACVVIGAEPMASLKRAAEANYLFLQLVQVFGYAVYLLVQLVAVCWIVRKQGAEFLHKLSIVVQFLAACAVGLHYFVTVFQRAMIDKAPRTSWKAYAIYSATFGILCLLSRPRLNKKDGLDADTKKL
eukprot:jgi/Mesen1/6862/ME000351S05979